MHRIDMPPGLNVTEDGDVVDVRVPTEAGTVTITVPVETSLQIKSSNGGVRVEGVDVRGVPGGEGREPAGAAPTSSTRLPSSSTSDAIAAGSTPSPSRHCVGVHWLMQA